MHWTKVVAFLEGKCQEFVSNKGTKPENGYARGFVLPSGLQLAVETNSEGETSNVWIEDCGPPPVPSHFQLYKEDKSRTSALSSVAPRLSGPGYAPTPQRAYKIRVTSNQELEALFDWYSSQDGGQSILKEDEESMSIETKQYSEYALNQILYGPPGTGKTYKSTALAVEICDGSAEMSRSELMARYEELRQEGRINFVTFHQSYGYEDFVEGLRPELKEGQVSYSVRPGVFREVSDAARRSTLVKPGLVGKPLAERTLYKMSLGIAGTVEGKTVYQECISNGYVLLGWGGSVDFSECNTYDEIRKKADEVGVFEKPKSDANFVSVFKDEVKINDIVIVSQGNGAFRAIGEVIGKYEFLEAPVAGHFHQMRRVRWLALFEGNRPVNQIYEKQFMQSSLYKLAPESLKFDVLGSILQGQQGASNQPFVLIIDEINRANISKVFGELITLLEADKREGKPNAIKVKLPYSGDLFSVPSNLYVIGTMNTADRSIALLDTALRRRFEFEELQPDCATLPEELVEGVDLRAMLQAMNDRIEYLYDRDHTIGHAYFINVKTLADLDAVFRRKVIPLLQEYFYENWSKVQSSLNDRVGGFIEVDTSLPKGLELVDEENDPRPRYRLKDGPFLTTAYQRIYQ